jgi:hypothetical protein
MGGIDLDPFSDEIEQAQVRAKNCFVPEDGLERDWFGRVWLAPTVRGMAPFMVKLVEEIDAGHVSQAIVLAPNYTDTTWFHASAPRTRCICFVKGRIKFIGAGDGKARSGTNGQIFLYFGENDLAFREHFGNLGAIRPLLAPNEIEKQQKPITPSYEGQREAD